LVGAFETFDDIITADRGSLRKQAEAGLCGRRGWS
jgi:hypothetical protein